MGSVRACVANRNRVTMVTRRTCSCSICLRCNTKLATRTIFTTIWVNITIRAVCALRMSMRTCAIRTSTMTMAREFPDSQRKDDKL